MFQVAMVSGKGGETCAGRTSEDSPATLEHVVAEVNALRRLIFPVADFRAAYLSRLMTNSIGSGRSLVFRLESATVVS